MEKTLIVLMGVQGSGKSTFYRRFLAEAYVRVNLDTLKTRHRERLLVEECLRQGRSFAVDNTNPTAEDRARYILPAKAAGFRVEGYFLDSRLQPCIERNNRREGKEKLPAHVIAATWKKLQMPSRAEGFDQLYFVRNNGQEMVIEEWREDEDEV